LPSVAHAAPKPKGSQKNIGGGGRASGPEYRSGAAEEPGSTIPVGGQLASPRDRPLGKGGSSVGVTDTAGGANFSVPQRPTQGCYRRAVHREEAETNNTVGEPRSGTGPLPGLREALESSPYNTKLPLLPLLPLSGRATARGAAATR